MKLVRRKTGFSTYKKHLDKGPTVLWLHSGQTTGHARDLSTSGHFPISSHNISTVNLRHSSHLGTKSNHSPSTNVLLPSFTALATCFFIWKSAPREIDDNNYSDYNKSQIPQSEIPQNSNLPPLWRWLVSMEMMQPIPTRARHKHAHSFDRCGYSDWLPFDFLAFNWLDFAHHNSYLMHWAPEIHLHQNINIIYCKI